MKKTLDTLPVLDGVMSSSFCACLSSVLLSQNKRIKANTQSGQKRLWSTFHSVLTASGLNFSYIYINNLSTYSKLNYENIFFDEYIKYALNFGNCNYHIETNNFNEEIIKSINNNIPVIAEGFTDLGWCLITGYDDIENKLFGYSIGCPNCDSCSNCVERYDNIQYENGLFSISLSNRLPKRIVIIDDFNAKPFDYQEYFSYWLSIMERKAQGDYLFGLEAFDAVIALLENDEYFENIDNDRLKEVYKFLFTNSFIPEYRCFVAFGLQSAQSKRALRKHIGLLDDANLEIEQGLQTIISNGFQSHKIGWKYWAKLSDEKVWHINTEKHSEKLRDKKVRKMVITQINKLRKFDESTLFVLKNNCSEQYSIQI